VKIVSAFVGISRHLASTDRGWGPAVGWVVVIGTAYFLASLMGFSLLVPPIGVAVAVFWPAAGICAGILIAFGRRTLPALAIGVMIGTVAANVLNDRSFATAVFKGFCNIGEPLILAWLLDRWFGPAFSFQDLRRVIGFLAATVIAAAISAIGGAATIILLHKTAPFWDIWRVWLLSHAVGIVAVAPLIVELRRAWTEPPSRRETIEGAAVLVIVAALAAYVYAYPTQSWISFDPDGFILPLLLWLAARWPSPFAIVGACIVSTAAVSTTIFGIGHLSDVLPIIERVHGVQMTVIMVTVFALVLVGLFTERRRSEEALKQSKDRLQLALDGADLGAFSANLLTGQFKCDTRTALFHGHHAPPTTIKEVRQYIHPDDLVRLDKALVEASRTGRVWNAEYRVLHSPGHAHAGETRWVTLEGSIMRDPRGTPVGLLGVTRDVTARKRVDEQQHALLRELDHRVKNVLATVSAVVVQTLGASSSMPDFAAALDGRIQSMARTHELLSASRWHGISVAELVQRELAPYTKDGNTDINGPEILLRAEAGQVMAMVIHELATNAAKHGALSTQNGCVSVRWRQRSNGHRHTPLVLEWRETAGPSVAAPKKSGYGTSTIRDVIPYEFRGSVDLTFAASGVRCRIELPADWLSNDCEPIAMAHASSPSA
jgi:PAS domain S-box-containing protein